MRIPVDRAVGALRTPAARLSAASYRPLRRAVAGRVRVPRGRLRVGTALVTGRSMEPTLHEGDRLLVAYGLPPRDGGLALVRLPDGPDGPRPLSVKRVSGRAPDEPDHWWVERDNPAMGVDSWQVGAIPDKDLVAAVLTRLPGRPVAVLSWRVLRRGKLG